MKPIFKHTAMAVFVSFGLSGCFLTGSSDKPNHQPEATQINQPQQPAEPVVAKKLDKNGEEWRHILVVSDRLADRGKSKTARYMVEGDFFHSDDEATKQYYFNLGEKQGLNQGIVEKVKIYLEEDGNFEFINDVPKNAKLVNELNYIVINQPYSSYGALFADGQAKLFYLGQSTNLFQDFQEAEEYTEYKVVKNSDSRGKNITWNNEIVGDAVYKGEVIAHIIRNDEKPGSPIIDGSITLNAHFENGDKSHISAVLDSKTLGYVNLGRSNIRQTSSQDFWNHSSITDKEGNEFSANYIGMFVGENMNDVIGHIDIDSENKEAGKIKHYDAVFGATKQK